MNLVELQKKLLTLARNTPPDERVPYAFEKRVMAGLLSKPIEDAWTLWGRALWRGAVACVVISILLSALSLLPDRPSPGSGQDLESTVFAMAEQLSDSW